MKILIITYSRFPEGDAESVRLHTIGKLLRDIGHSVSFVGMGFGNYLEKLEYDGFPYISLRKESNSNLSKFYYYFNFNNRLKRYLLSYLRSFKLDAILFADVPLVTINMLKKICKQRDVQLITDSVEWYSPEQFKYGSLSPSMILKNIENKYAIDQTIKVISISNYLYSHFKGRGCTCIRIPVILDVENMSYEKKIDFGKLTILYAGSPGKKDYVGEMLKGVLLLNEKDLNKLKFVLAGVSLNDIHSFFTLEELSVLKKHVLFLGRIDRSVVIQRLSEADFTVLLRSPDQRYAKAGFPTKVVESLATGTPVILNLTSDLGNYIHDMQEGLIVHNCSAIEFAKTLKRALNLNRTQREIMSNRARLCAEINFDYRIYTKIMSDLINWR